MAAASQPHPLKGDNSSARLVHALAMQLRLRSGSDIRVVTLTNGPRAGQRVARLFVSYDDLAALVSNALAPSSLRQIVRNHPAMSIDGDALVVDLPDVPGLA